MSDQPLALRDYQLVARDFLRAHPRAGLFLDMGLGKTCVSLSALQPHHLPALVLAPKRVAETVWDAEAALWRPDLTVVKAVGSPAQRKDLLARHADVTVLSRENQGDLASLPPGRPEFRTLILDELSGYKGRGARWKSAVAFLKAYRVPYVWGLTGTPVSNGYLDVWPQIALLDRGERLGKNISTYRSRYFYPGRRLPNGVVSSWELREGAEEKIKAKIEDICLYMESEGLVQLPEFTINYVPVRLPPRVKTAYREFAKKLLTDLTDVLGGEVVTAASRGVLTAKLSQVAAGQLYVDEAHTTMNGKYIELHSAKLDAVREIVEGSGSPVLVFYRFRHEFERLQKALPGSRSFTNDRYGADAATLVRQWNEGKIPVLLAHPASVGHGLNLQHGGHTAVWTSPPWDLDQWEQANKRLHRSGQRHPVVIHVVVAPGTIDDLIIERLAGKASVQQDLLKHLESPL